MHAIINGVIPTLSTSSRFAPTESKNSNEEVDEHTAA